MRVRAIALLLALPACCAQAQFKWIDHDGQVGYGDQAPRDAQHVERIAALPAAGDTGDAMAQLPYELRQATRNFPVTLYARPNCAPCELARSALRDRGIPYAERSVVSQEDVTAFQVLGGGDQLPALGVGRQFLRGYTAGTWSETLSSAGYPASSMLPPQWQLPAATPLAATSAAGGAPAAQP